MPNLKFNFAYKIIQSFGGKFFDLAQYFLISYFLAKGDFNIFVYIFSILAFFTLISEFGISAIISKYFAENDCIKTRKKLLNISLLTTLIISILLFLISYSFGQGFLLDKGIYNYFIFGFLFVLFNSFFMIFDGIFRGMEKFKSAMFLDLGGKFIGILSLFYLINNFGIIGAIVSKGIYYIIPVLFLFFYSKKLLSSGTISERQEDGFLKRFFRLSVWMLMFNLFYLFYTRIDIIMLDYYGYKNILGSYDIANQIFLVFQTIFATAALVIAPRIAKLNKIKDYVNIKKHLNKTLLYAFFGSIIIGLVCYYPVAFFVPILFGKYDIGVILSIIKLLLFSLPFMGIRAIISGGFIVPSGNPKILTVSMILMGILNVVLNMLLIPRYGYIGSIAGTITISYIIISLQLCWYIRSLNLNIKKNV